MEVICGECYCVCRYTCAVITGYRIITVLRTYSAVITTYYTTVYGKPHAIAYRITEYGKPHWRAKNADSIRGRHSHSDHIAHRYNMLDAAMRESGDDVTRDDVTRDMTSHVMTSHAILSRQSRQRPAGVSYHQVISPIAIGSGR